MSLLSRFTSTCSRGGVIKVTQVEKQTISSTCENRRVMWLFTWFHHTSEIVWNQQITTLTVGPYMSFWRSFTAASSILGFPYFLDGKPSWESNEAMCGVFIHQRRQFILLSSPLQSDRPSFCRANIILKYVAANYSEILTFCQNKLTSSPAQPF